MSKKTEKNKEVAVSVKYVSKNFHLPHEASNSIKSKIINVFKPRDKEVDVQHALKDVSFEIEKGEFFGILGRNGSGKSTLLKILAEIYQPTSGQVAIHGKLVPFIELGVGFNPELTGRENVYLNGALLGFSRKEIQDRYDEIVEFSELGDFMDQKLKNYSSGMQVRLAFSVATRAEADILLVDEVLAVGDADFQRKCFNYFKALKKSKTTVIFVSHDMNAVREFCDRAVLINDSEIIESGDANFIANQYTKLFNAPIDSKGEKNTNDNRWGDRVVQLENAEILAVSEEYVEFSTVISPIPSDDNVVVGFRIKDSAGKVVAGFNTQQMGDVKLSSKSPTTLKWKLDNIFSSSVYTIDITIRSSDGSSIHDNWDECLSFEVVKTFNVPYAISPPVSVDVVGVE